MRNRLVSFLGMVLLLTGLLTGCDKSSAEAGAAADGAKKRAADEVIVTMPTTSEPESGFDPAYGWGAGEHVHEPLIQSTLTTTTKDLKIEKDLATDYQASPDGLTWTVTIRDDVAFTDGEPLTAEDVAFTYNHCKEKSTVNDFTMLDKAVAVDDKTVEFHMTRAFSIWPYTMAVVGIIPEHAYDENYGQNPVGSGRYIMKKFKQCTGLSLKTVDNRGFNLPSIEPQEKDGITYGNAFTADVNVRRAINIGIDREEMIENVLNGYGTQAYSVCDKMPWYNSQCEVDYDQEEARRLLTEAGWVEGKDGIREKDGKRAVFTLMFSTGDSVRQALAEDAANQLKEIGIEVKTEGVGWDVAYDRAQSEPLMWGWGAHTPMELYNIYHSLEGRGIGQAEYSPYSNGQADQYMDQALSTGSLEDSYELWKKAQWDGTTGIIQEGDIPWIWLCNIDHLYFVRDGLRVAEQKIHPHGHGWSIVNNVDQWSWETAE